MSRINSELFVLVFVLRAASHFLAQWRVVSFVTNENIEAPQPTRNELKCDIAVVK